jgi:hypothetical protein
LHYYGQAQRVARLRVIRAPYEPSMKGKEEI